MEDNEIMFDFFLSCLKIKAKADFFFCLFGSMPTLIEI